MKKVILTAILVCSGAFGAQDNRTQAQKVYHGLSKSNEDKQLSVDQVPQGVSVLSLPIYRFDLLDLKDLNPNRGDVIYSISNPRFNGPMCIVDSNDLVDSKYIPTDEKSPCDISAFVGSFGADSIRCMTSTLPGGCCSRILASHALAINLLRACKEGKTDEIRGILSYIHQDQAPKVIKEAMAILPPQGLEHLKSACLHGTVAHNKLHFRGHTEQCPAIVGLLINASVSSAQAQTPKSPVLNTQPPAKKTDTNLKKTKDSTSVSSTTSWTRFWWLGGGLGIAAVAAYFFFIRNK